MRPRSRPFAQEPGKHASVQDPILTSQWITYVERNLRELHGALLTCHSGPSTVASVGMLKYLRITPRSCSITFWHAGCGTPRKRAVTRLRRAILHASGVLHNRRRRQYAAVRAHDELAQFETLCGFTHEVCDAIVDLSSAFVQSGTNPQTARALAVLPLGHHTVPAQEGSRGKTGAVGDSAKSKQEQCERAVRYCCGA